MRGGCLFLMKAISRCGHGDALLLRWGVLAAASLALTVVAQACGLFAFAGGRLSQALAAPPFYLPAEGMRPVLGNGALFGICAAVVLYGSAVLLRSRTRGRAVVLWLVWVVAAALPAAVAALWNGYLNMAAPVFGLTVAALLRVSVPFFHSSR